MITKRLLDVCDFQGGTQPPKEEWINDPREGYVRMLQIRDYSQGDAKFIQYVKDTKKLHKCKKDDIMLSRYGYIGQAFMGLEGAYNVALVKVIKKEEIHTPYLLYYFQSYYFQHFLLSNVGARATIPGFNKDELENALIRLPEKREQVEIASKIAKVDELIGYHKQQLDILDALIKSRFIEMFGDPVLNPQGWKTKPLLEMGNCKNGMNFHDGDDGVEINCLGVGDFKDLAIIDKTYELPTISLNEAPPKEYLLKDGDIVFVRSNGNKALVGRCLVVYPHDTPTTYSGFCIRYRLTTDELETQYLLRVLKTESIRKKMAGRGANIQNLNQQILASLIIPIPPKDLQQQFAAFVEQTDKSKFYIIQTQKIIELLIRAIQYTTKEVLL